ncbi:MAG TPA: hypothetical protein VKY27_00765 [Bacteriovoracaceae bacterium]|nr:hypothetical protein [Bacteriovoracaceae bacterium]
MKLKKESGQSTIEFIFAFAFGVSIVFMVFNSALNYATGYLVHYATFMASRTYLVSDNYQGFVAAPTIPPVNDAIEVYERYRLDIFDIPSSGFSINRQENSPSSAEYLTVGARTLFEKPIDALGRVVGGGNLEFVSESFLGKEPTRSQCASRVCFAVTGAVCGGNTGDYDVTFFDNGC